MKTEIKQGTQVFKPIVLNLTIESLEELITLRGLSGINNIVATTLKDNAAFTDEISKKAIADILSQAFYPLEVAHKKLLEESSEQ